MKTVGETTLALLLGVAFGSCSFIILAWTIYGNPIDGIIFSLFLFPFYVPICTLIILVPFASIKVLIIRNIVCKCATSLFYGAILGAWSLAVFDYLFKDTFAKTEDDIVSYGESLRQLWPRYWPVAMLSGAAGSLIYRRVWVWIVARKRRRLVDD